MENVNDIIAAIDIGTTKIVAVIGKITNEKRFEIIGFGSSPSNGIRRGVVYNVDDTIDSIELAINKANRSASLKIKDVFVGIAGQHISSRKNRCKLNFEELEHTIADYDLIQLKELAKNTISDPGEEIIDIIPQSYIVDDEFGIDNPCGMKGALLQANFHLVLGKMSMVNNIKQCVLKTGLNVESLFLEPLASAEAVLSPIEKQSGVVMVDIGGGTTDIAIYQNDKVVHTAVIPIGGRSITNDIQNFFSILEAQAEDLKVKYGSAIPEKSQEDLAIRVKGLKGRDDKEIMVNDLAKVIQAKMEEILYSVMFQVESVGIKNKLTAGIVITGGGSLLKNLKPLVSLITKNDVRIATPSEFVVGDFAHLINKPQCSTAVGLIILGHKYKINQIQLTAILDRLNAEKLAKEELEYEEEDNKPKEKKQKGDLINRFKNRIFDFLDED